MSDEREIGCLTMGIMIFLAAWIVKALGDIAHAIESVCK